MKLEVGAVYRCCAAAWFLLTLSPIPYSLTPVAAAQPSLTAQIDALLDVPAYEDAHWGVQVVNLETGQTLYRRDEGKLFIPASTQKLLTTAAALDLLGPTFRYVTPLYLDGRVEGSTLIGNLVVRGVGDPTIGGRYTEGDKTLTFRAWADALRARGITRITGNVLGDDDVFDETALGPAWSWDDLPFYYAAEIAGLSYNEGTVELLVEATTPGQPTQITWEPAMTPYVQVENTSQTAAAGTPYDEGYARDLSGNTITVSSTVAAGRQDFEAIAVHNPTAYFAQVLLETLEAQGIEVDGQAFDADALSDMPFDYAQMTTLASHASPTLAEIARDVNVRSNNLAAEHLFKTLGAQIYPALSEAQEDDAPEVGSFQAGALATRAFLGRAGVDTSRVRVRDGSGLSYQNLVRPADFTALLTYMDRHPEPAVRAAFFDSLPVGGRDGTIARRFQTGRAGGNVRAKTGFITGARALVGVVTTAGGSRLGFALLANHYSVRTRQVNATQDAIVELLASWPR